MRRRSARHAASAVALLAAACVRREPAGPAACSADSPAVPAPHVAEVPHGPHVMRTIDEVRADLSRRLPGGYAGMYRDGDRIVLLLADTTNLEATLAALRPALDSIYRSHTRSTFTLEGAGVRKVRWSFAQLYDWERHIMNVAWAGGDVNMSAIDERANRITYGVATAEARRRLEARLAASGVPCGLVEVRIQEPISTGEGTR